METKSRIQPISLAVHGYDSIPTLNDDEKFLNLAWTADEREFLKVDLKAYIQNELNKEVAAGLDYIERYFVNDPYCSNSIAPALDRYFGINLFASVTCGAGVGSLLAALANLTRERPLVVIGEIYPDLPFWVARSGGTIASVQATYNKRKIAPLPMSAIIFLERPAFRSELLDNLSDVLSLCHDAAIRDSIVIIDESNANYCSPSYSAALLVKQVNNLVVLRGLSKAYGMGGLRFGCCIASSTLESRLREVIPPLQVSSLSIRLAQMIFELGDITAPLRVLIDRRKMELQEQLSLLQIKQASRCNTRLPYFLFSSELETQKKIRAAGILGKIQRFRAIDGRPASVLRLSTPLKENRMFRLKEIILNAASNTSPKL